MVFHDSTKALKRFVAVKLYYIGPLKFDIYIKINVYSVIK